MAELCACLCPSVFCESVERHEHGGQQGRYLSGGLPKGRSLDKVTQAIPSRRSIGTILFVPNGHLGEAEWPDPDPDRNCVRMIRNRSNQSRFRAAVSEFENVWEKDWGQFDLYQMDFLGTRNARLGNHLGFRQALKVIVLSNGMHKGVETIVSVVLESP